MLRMALCLVVSVFTPVEALGQSVRLECAAISSGVANSDAGLILNLGQPLAGFAEDRDNGIAIGAGIIHCLVGCFADFNGDGAVDTRDVIAFLNAWSTGDPHADCDHNGAVDTRDVICFLNAWSAGCA